MNEIVTLVLRAQSATASEAERRDAFGKLVLRFQDMAFACALVMLGDRFLAADAAQEAFVTAWRRRISRAIGSFAARPQLAR